MQIADFFAKRKRTAVPKINLIKKETTAPAPPKKNIRNIQPLMDLIVKMIMPVL